MNGDPFEDPHPAHLGIFLKAARNPKSLLQCRRLVVALPGDSCQALHGTNSDACGPPLSPPRLLSSLPDGLHAP